ncbi:phosphogluconate dehydrogenase C-terminal domain-containing protein [Marispirochaeta aestuarii]|nr:phosphogluconate dehydrogenase C-terminal domain-containing protein [Marispirochaeta aestuarii]
MKVALMGAGGKMGLRIVEKLSETEGFEVIYVQRKGPGFDRLVSMGLQPVSNTRLIPEVDVAILAVPDAAIAKVSAEIIPLLPPHAMVFGLDPAAAHAKVMPIRKDLSYFIAHPCHPPLFNDEVTEEARNDHFGGIAKQHIVCALYQGPDTDYDRGEKLAKIIYSPVMNSYRLTVEQMAVLEPALVETIGVTVLVAVREALEKAIKMGAPEEAAREFLFGHLQIAISQVFGFVDYPMSDGAQLAAKKAFSKIFRPDWMDNVMNPERIAESVAEITHAKK